MHEATRCFAWLERFANTPDVQVGGDRDAVEICVQRGDIRIVITAAPTVLEWYVDVEDDSGFHARDWCDYAGYDDTPHQQLTQTMSADLEAFVERLTTRRLRLVEHACTTRLEWETTEVGLRPYRSRRDEKPASMWLATDERRLDLWLSLMWIAPTAANREQHSVTGRRRRIGRTTSTCLQRCPNHDSGGRGSILREAGCGCSGVHSTKISARVRIFPFPRRDAFARASQRSIVTLDGRMILVLMDDGVLKIYESLTAAELDVEGLDAPEVFRAIFDSDGAPYRIEWLVPNSLSRTIIGIGSATSGSYRLVAAGPPDPQAFSRLLMSVEYVDPPSRTQEILELRRRHSHAV